MRRINQIKEAKIAVRLESAVDVLGRHLRHPWRRQWWVELDLGKALLEGVL